MIGDQDTNLALDGENRPSLSQDYAVGRGCVFRARFHIASCVATRRDRSWQLEGRRADEGRSISRNVDGSCTLFARQIHEPCKGTGRKYSVMPKQDAVK